MSIEYIVPRFKDTFIIITTTINNITDTFQTYDSQLTQLSTITDNIILEENNPQSSIAIEYTIVAEPKLSFIINQ